MAMLVKGSDSMFTTYNNYRKHKKKYDKSFGEIATGASVRNAEDNASAWGIGERMRVQLHGFVNDKFNVQNSSALLSVVAESMQNIVDEMRRMKQLAIDAANDTNNEFDRKSLEKELEQRVQTIDMIAKYTNYNDISLLDGEFAQKLDENGIAQGNKLVVHHGTESGQAIWLYLESMKTEDLKEKIVDDDGNFLIDRDLIDLQALSSMQDQQDKLKDILKKADGMSLADIEFTTADTSRVALRVIDGALETAVTQLAHVGAYQARMEYNMNNILTQEENIQAAESNISDSDMAKSILEMTKDKFYMDAAQNMLAQANSNAGDVLSLLQ